MTEHDTDNHPVELNADEARSGETSMHMRYVLGASLTAIIIVMAVIMIRQWA